MLHLKPEICGETEKYLLLQRINLQETPLRYLIPLPHSGRTDVAALGAEITQLQDVVKALPPDDPDRAAKLSKLSNLLLTRYHLKENPEDNEEALQLAEQAIAATPAGHPDLALRINCLASMLGQRYRETGEDEEIAKALELVDRAIGMTNDQDPQLSDLHSCKGSLLFAKFEQNAELDDLDQAIEWTEKAGVASKWRKVSDKDALGNMLHSRYVRKGQAADLDRAIQLAQETVESIDDETNPHDKAQYLMNLGIKLGTRYEEKVDLAILGEGIRYLSEALKVAPSGDNIRVRVMTNLSNLLDSKYSRTGLLVDLQESIDLADSALKEIGFVHRDRFWILHNLSNRLENRYKHTGALDDLTQAIKWNEEAIGLPLDDPLRAGALTSLSNKLELLHVRTDEIPYLEQAVSRAEEAVKATPEVDRSRSETFSNLSNKLAKLYKRNKDFNAIERAVEFAMEAFQSLTLDHTRFEKAQVLANQSYVLRLIGEANGDEESILWRLEHAIDLAQQAVSYAPEDLPERATYLLTLGDHLKRRFELIKKSEDALDAVKHLNIAYAMPHVAPRVRIKIARMLVDLLVELKDWKEASKIARDAIELLPLLSPRVLSQKDQQDALKQVAGFASLAAAVALEAGEEASHALTLLEHGRGIITGFRFGDRIDLRQLHEKHTTLAERFESLRDELIMPRNTLQISAQPWTSRRYLANEELEATIKEIRALPGFSKFLQPPEADEQMAAAVSGAIVMINVSFRCDAFLIQMHGIVALPLSQLKSEEISLHSSTLRLANSNPDMLALLIWLWNVVAKPTLDALGPAGKPDPGTKKLPRVWWILTGSLGHFPIHAAGVHWPLGSNNSVIDRVVSSYIPSVKSLVYSRENQSSQTRQTAGNMALLVPMATTPGDSAPLTHVEAEVRLVADRLKGPMLITYPPTRSKKVVLSLLNNCMIFHFAGHGISSPLDPSQSCLLLENAGEVDPLAVTDLLDMSLHEKQPLLAYLSACSTGDNQVETLSDEGLHMMGAFQLAGFQNVIGALWKIPDRESVKVADGVYTTMVEAEMRNESVSLGLHKRLRDLRSASKDTVTTEGSMIVEDSLLRGAVGVKVKIPIQVEKRVIGEPLVWAAYIHTGI